MSTATVEATETALVRHYKTPKNGWVVKGPASLVVEGPVAVTENDGTTSVVLVHSVGREFLVDGVPHRYGYRGARPESSPAPARAAVVPPAPGLGDVEFMPDDFSEAGDYVPEAGIEDYDAWG